MTLSRLIADSLRFYWRTNIGVVLGSAVGTAVIVAGLLAGASVRHSLKRQGEARLGRITHAVVGGDRFFRSALAADLAATAGVHAAPAILLQGTAVEPASQGRLNGVQVLGIDSGFAALADAGAVFSGLSKGSALLNSRAAARLGVRNGDELVLRIAGAHVAPVETPLVSDKDLSVTMRVKVAGTVGDDSLGRFSLQANPLVPPTVFVALGELSGKLDVPNMANAVLLSDKSDRSDESDKGQTLRDERIKSALAAAWTMRDAGLVLETAGGSNVVQLSSHRVFLEPELAGPAMKAAEESHAVLGYFVNGFKVGEKSSPYGFAAGLDKAIAKCELKDDEAAINDWLAGDLGARVGDRVEISYFVLGPMRRLETKSSVFTVKAILPLTVDDADKKFMPLIPGLSDAESCKDWDPGIPMDMSKIRPADEDYWKKYRGTPKAYVTLAKAREMWSNRYGDVTAIRYQGEKINLAGMEQKLKSVLSPESVGLVLRNVKAEADKAGAGSVDFGELFLGLSMFILFAAVMLTGLLFSFAVEHRASEIGTLMALGFTVGWIRLAFVVEALALACAGGLLGVPLGIYCNGLTMSALSTIWSGAVGGAVVQSHVDVPSVLTGFASGVLVAVVVAVAVLGRIISKSIASIQRSGVGVSEAVSARRKLIVGILAGVCLAGAVGMVVMSLTGAGKDEVGIFFGAGSLLLTCSFLAAYLLFARREGDGAMKGMGFVELALSGSFRRRWRSLATVGLLAAGIFVVVAVGANRLETGAAALSRTGGTGGFSLIGNLTVGLLGDLNKPDVQKKLGLDADSMTGVSFVQLRRKDGDDASCLNLNKSQTPPLLGVNPAELAGRGAFTFLATTESAGGDSAWLMLDRKFDDGAVPGVADQTVITYGLGKKLGDTVRYVDERGRSFNVRLVGALANSVLQGNIIISEENFMKLYPSAAGYRMLLVDGGRANAVSRVLSDRLQDYGIDVVPAAVRLAEFAEVENTYLGIFLALGGLGVLIGSFGLGLVVMRNIMERRPELALLRAVGFSAGQVGRLLVIEHLFLLFLGLMCGAVSAGVAVLPAVKGAHAGQFLAVEALILAILVNGVVWTVLASRMATRAGLVASLRNE